MVISVINKDHEVYKKFKGYCLDVGKPVTQVLWEFIELTVEKFGRGMTLDPFLDPNFIPVPKITDGYAKTLEYLKTQNNEKLEESRDSFYCFYIITKALLDSPDKKNFNLDYVAAWHRYR